MDRIVVPILLCDTRLDRTNVLRWITALSLCPVTAGTAVGDQHQGP